MSNYTEAVDDIKKAKDALDALQTSSYNKLKNPKNNHPDAKKHKYISFVKSGIRIVACGFLAYYEIQIAAVLFLVAELLGVAEELV
jgi:hypothetical protein